MLLMIFGKINCKFTNNLGLKSNTFTKTCNFKSQDEYKKFMRKAKKIKGLDEDNKKLRTLLKVHIENSEKLRIET